MSNGDTKEQPELTKKQKTQLEKQAEHIARIKRTLIACLIGILVGALSFYSGGIPDARGLQNNGLLAFMLMLAGIVIQKHIFILTGIDTSGLGAKDWFYQGFMTFALWFMTWAILLSSMLPAAGFSANVTTGKAPVAVAFTESATGSPTGWTWDFGDGTNSTVKNPVHVYTTAGKFNVTLSVTNAWGSNLEIRKDFITVAPPAAT
jgi:hypothetical protein